MILPAEATPVLRAASCLFGRYTEVARLDRALPDAKCQGAITWPGKEAATFSDTLTAVRRWLWAEEVFPQVAGTPLWKNSDPRCAISSFPPSPRPPKLHQSSYAKGLVRGEASQGQ